MRLVTTLPITPREEHEIGIFNQPLIAQMLARYLGADLTIAINNQGMLTGNFSTSPEGLLAMYLNLLKGIGLFAQASEKIWIDTDPEYALHVQEVAQGLYHKGILTWTRKILVHCPCGRVELPIAVFDQLRKRSSQLLTTVNGRETCKVCHGQLTSDERRCLAMQIPPQSTINIYPETFAAKAKALRSEELNREWIVSRHFRGGNSINLGGEEVVVDTEFWWLPYLLYITRTTDASEVFVVTGHRTLTKLMRTLSLMRVFAPSVEVSGLLCPMVKIVDGKTQLSTMSAEGFLGLPYSVTAKRLFLAHAFRWNDQVSNLNSGKLYWAHVASQAKIDLARLRASQGGASLDGFLETINPAVIDKALKDLRHGRLEEPVLSRLVSMIWLP